MSHTARGAQQGEWCEDKNHDSFSAGARSHWRRYHVEDIVPPASRQLVSVHFAVHADWDVEVLFAKVTLAPPSLVGSRPKHHPFAPHGMNSSLNCRSQAGYKDPVLEAKQPSYSKSYSEFPDEDLEVQLALALSLQDAVPRPELATEVSGRRWARRKQAPRECAVCLETMTETLSCCDKTCASCARHWAAEQESQGLALDEISCPFCGKALDSLDGSWLATFLGKDALDRLQQRMQLRETQLRKLNDPDTRLTPLPPESSVLPSRILMRLGLKQCPGCGEGMQKESETCHKMICRSCRARFCFRCLARLEYFNCGCTGAEHNFVDPLDGSIRSHQ